MYEVLYNLTKPGTTKVQALADMAAAANGTPQKARIQQFVTEGKIVSRSTSVAGDTFTSKQVWINREAHDSWSQEIYNNPTLMAFHTNLQSMGYAITISKKEI